MNLQHINLKIFVQGELTVDWSRFIEVFHRWTAAQSMPEMMIDVADYRHVPNGPGVVMVGHEADYFLDNTAGRPGLRYSCKVEQPGSNEDRVRGAFSAASTACVRLESELPGLKFSRTELALTINDRAVAPNTDETHAAVSAELPKILESVLGTGDMELEYHRDPRQLYGVTIKLPQPIELAAA